MINIETNSYIQDFFDAIDKKAEEIKYTVEDLNYVLSENNTEVLEMSNILDPKHSHFLSSDRFIFNLDIKSNGYIKNEACYKSKYRNHEIFYKNMCRKISEYNIKYKNENNTIAYIESENLSIFNFIDLDTDIINLEKPAGYVEDGFANKLIYDTTEHKSKIFYLDYYYKHFFEDCEGLYTLNPKFNSYCQRILNLKDNIDEEVNYFSDKLIYVIKDAIMNNELFQHKKPDIITCVPSHMPGEISEGLQTIANNLCKEFGSVNMCGLLRRTNMIQKLTHGGPRNIEVHLNSIEMQYSSIIDKQNFFKDKIIYIIDDVTTTGNSLNACRQIIQQSVRNVHTIRCIALAKTLRS